VNLEACLPAQLRGSTISRISAGLSGAGIYRVDADGGAFVLKISEAGDLDAWRRQLAIRKNAAAAGLAPAVVHADEERRAVVSAFVVDRSFPALYLDPRTRDDALVLLGRTLRRVHALPLPDGPVQDPREILGLLWGKLAGFAVPAFVGDAIRRAIDEPSPADGGIALCHNDVNPTNLVYDGERLMLLDWEVAAANDPVYDLAAIALFLRMDDDACRKLVAAHDEAPIGELPARFGYNRRLVAAMCGAMFTGMARAGGHPGATGETLESTPSLVDFYQRLRAGAVNLASPEGQWWFGLALVKAGAG
jgi:hypothetical protein